MLIKGDKTGIENVSKDMYILKWHLDNYLISKRNDIYDFVSYVMSKFSFYCDWYIQLKYKMNAIVGNY